MKRLSLSALAISFAIAAPAMAQQTPTPATPDATQVAPAAQDAAAPAAATVTPGMPVKDNTGTTIGAVASVQPGPSGAPVATIKMGAKSFAVDPSALAVQGGAATINVTKAQIEEDFFKHVRPSSLLQRFATCPEVASMVAYLASPLAAATNGAAVRVEGGVLRSIL